MGECDVGGAGGAPAADAGRVRPGSHLQQQCSKVGTKSCCCARCGRLCERSADLPLHRGAQQALDPVLHCRGHLLLVAPGQLGAACSGRSSSRQVGRQHKSQQQQHPCTRCSTCTATEAMLGTSEPATKHPFAHSHPGGAIRLLASPTTRGCGHQGGPSYLAVPAAACTLLPRAPAASRSSQTTRPEPRLG